MMEDTIKIKHTRSDYNFVDLLGDLGGLQYMLASFIGFFFLALSEFNIFIEIFDKLFHLKDSENELLFNVKKEVKMDLSKFKNVAQNSHPPIKLTKRQYVQLFILDKFPCFKFMINNGKKKNKILQKTR